LLASFSQPNNDVKNTMPNSEFENRSATDMRPFTPKTPARATIRSEREVSRSCPLA
jgi:hypothetical protein